MVNTGLDGILPSYLRFLQLADSLCRMKLMPKLDPIEELLLDSVSIDYLGGRDVLVGEVLALSAIGSRATIHKRIQNLISNGYLSLKIDQEDARRKYLVPTALTKMRYEALSRAISKVASSV